MAKVYLSSTVLDLKDERDAVTRWLIAADHQPVHSYVADGETANTEWQRDLSVSHDKIGDVLVAQPGRNRLVLRAAAGLGCGRSDTLRSAPGAD